MAHTFDATLKDMGRDSPLGMLTTFDGPPTGPVKLLNVDLSAVTSSTDLIPGIGDPVREVLHYDFQASAAALKHADLLVYNALLFKHYRVPVHSTIILLRPEAAHSNVNGIIQYAPRQGRGRMDFGFEIIRLWQHPVEQFLTGDVGMTPLAMLGQLPAELPEEEALARVAQRLVERVSKEVTPDRVRKLLTTAWLLTGLRVRRDVATNVFRGVHAMQESDTYLMVLEEGQEKALREAILAAGGVLIGSPDDSVRNQLSNTTDLERLKRMHLSTLKAKSWQEVLNTN